MTKSRCTQNRLEDSALGFKDCQVLWDMCIGVIGMTQHLSCVSGPTVRKNWGLQIRAVNEMVMIEYLGIKPKTDWSHNLE